MKRIHIWKPAGKQVRRRYERKKNFNGYKSSASLPRRCVSLFLLLCMAIPMLPGFGGLLSFKVFADDKNVGATADVTRQADPSTLDTYREMLNFSQNTRYAGRLWSDKSVFAYDATDQGNRAALWKGNALTLTQGLDGVNGQIALNDDFLHVFSTLGSSLELNESTTAPVDLVILLDMSGSMASQVSGATGNRIDRSRLGQVLSSINETIGTVMGMNETNRVAVIGYGATAYTLMELGHYKPASSEAGDPYKGAYLSARNLTGYTNTSEPSGSGAYTVEANVLKETELGNDETYQSYHRSARNNYQQNGGTTDTLIGYHTDLQAGIYQGFDELYKNLKTPEDVTYTYYSKLTNKTKTISRVPLAIVMTDGGSNYALKDRNTAATGDEWHQVPITENVAAGYNASYKKYRAENDADATHGGGEAVILDILMTASYMKSKIQNKYTELLTKAGLLSKGAKADFKIHTVSVDTPTTIWQIPRVYAGLDPKDFFNEDPQKVTLKDGKSIDPSEWKQRVDIITAYQKFMEWEASASGTSIAFRDSDTNRSIPFNKLTDESEVTNAEVFENIRYNDTFIDTGTADLTDAFQDLIEKSGVSLVTPVAGENDLGVDSNSITYMDPVGKYMDVKDVTDLTLFGTLYSVGRSAVYSYEWNDLYMANQSKGGERQPFPEGWYRGDPVVGSNAGVEYSKELPSGCATSKEAFDNGWVYRLNSATASIFVPSLQNIDSSESATDKQRHTEYTFYRLRSANGKELSDADLQTLHRNPAYGTDASIESDVKYDESGNGAHMTKQAGVYALMDLRIWVENTGDYSDPDVEGGGFESDANFDEALYVNIPVNMLPLRKISISAGADGSITYTTNIPAEGAAVEPGSVESASFPLRIFYTVGMESELLTADGSIDLGAGVSPEYIANNLIATEEAETARGLASGNVEFFSNWYNPVNRYADYAVTGIDYTYGDPIVSFSPSTANRYYIFEKSLPLYSTAYIWVREDDLSDADKTNPVYTDMISTYGGLWKRVSMIEDPTDGQDAEAQVFNPTDFGGKLLVQDLETDALHSTDPDDARRENQQSIWAALTTQKITPSELTGGEIILLKAQRLSDVTYHGEGSDPFSSTAYYYLPIDYYDLQSDGVAKQVKYVVSRKGSEFGSAYTTSRITNSDMLCWHDMSGQYADYPYLSRTETKDDTRGRKYIGVPLDETGYYAGCSRNDHQIPADDYASAPDYDADMLNKGEWVVSAKPGGLRVGDLAQDVHNKGGNYTAYPDGYIRQRFSDYTELTWGRYDGNITRTANNYYLPTISTDSTARDEDIIVNVYLGNNGRLAVEDTAMLLTKRVLPEEGLDFSANPNKEFDFQVYIEGNEGAYQAVVMRYNEAVGIWKRQLHYVDLELDGSLFLQTNDGQPAMVDAMGCRVIRSISSDADGNYTYAYAEDCTDAAGNTHSAGEVYTPPSEGGPYYVYIGTNGEGGEDINAPSTGMRVFYNNLVDGNGSVSKDDVIVKLVDSGGNARDYDPNSDWNSGIAATETLKFYAAQVWLFTQEQYDKYSGRANAEGLATVADRPEFDGSESLKSLTNFELLTIDPNASDTTDMTISSPYRTSSAYWTETVYFGYKAGATSSTGLDGSVVIDGEKLTADDLYLTDGAKAENTAEVTLKDGYGLLFTSMQSGTGYAMAERLGADDADYSFRSVQHVWQRGVDTYTADDFPDDDRIYSVSGNTGALEEAAHYINNFIPDVLIVQKSLVGENGTAIHPADREISFTYDAVFQMPGSTAENPIYRETDLYYWKGKTDNLGTTPNPFDLQAVKKAIDDGILVKLPVGTEHKYSFTLKAEESIVFYGLDIGTIFTVTEQKHELYPALDDQYTVTGTIASSRETTPWHETVNRADFTNEKPGNQLVIAKTVESSSLTEEERNKGFDFAIALTSPSGELNGDVLKAVKTDASGSVVPNPITWDAPQAGKPLTGHFQLKHGERLAISGLPENTTYTVTEEWDDDFRLQRVVDADGELFTLQSGAAGEPSSATGTIPGNGGAYMEFINARAFSTPFAGGPGWMLWSILGAMLILLPPAVYLLYKRRRKSM